MSRDEIRKQMRRARTLDECRAAWVARSAYLREHPDDETIVQEGEALSMKQRALQAVAERSAAAAPGSH